MYHPDFLSEITRIGVSFETNLHKFRLLSTNAQYVGSGAVPGSALNQFSMQELHRVLFVATNEASPWWGRLNLRKGKITVLSEV